MQVWGVLPRGMDPKILEKFLFWSKAGGTELLLRTRGQCGHEIQWYWMSCRLGCWDLGGWSDFLKGGFGYVC